MSWLIVRAQLHVICVLIWARRKDGSLTEACCWYFTKGQAVVVVDILCFMKYFKYPTMADAGAAMQSCQKDNTSHQMNNGALFVSKEYLKNEKFGVP